MSQGTPSSLEGRLFQLRSTLNANYFQGTVPRREDVGMGLQMEVGIRSCGVEMSAIDIDGAASSELDNSRGNGRAAGERDLSWTEVAPEGESEEDFYLRHLKFLRKTPNSQVSSSSGERGFSHGKGQSSSGGVQDGDEVGLSSAGGEVRGRESTAGVGGEGGAGVWGRENSWKTGSPRARYMECRYDCNSLAPHTFVPALLYALCSAPTICTLRIYPHNANGYPESGPHMPLAGGVSC